jgi:hypothetical protein
MNVINKCYKEHKKFYCSVYDYRLDDGIRFLADAKDFFFVASPDQLWGPSSLLSNGYPGSIHRSKARPDHDADHSTPI